MSERTRLFHDEHCETGRPVGDTYTVNGCDCAIRECIKLEREREADRAAIRDLEGCSNYPESARWRQKHKEAIQRAQDARAGEGK